MRLVFKTDNLLCIVRVALIGADASSAKMTAELLQSTDLTCATQYFKTDCGTPVGYSGFRVGDEGTSGKLRSQSFRSQ
jgi:hypothetical protein